MTSRRALAAEKREQPDPTEGARPVPWYVVLLAGGLASICIAYIVDSNVNTPSEWGDARTGPELSSAKPAVGAKVDGAALFASTCAACHQATGEGLPGVFPPLAGSEWVKGKETTLAAIVLQGTSGSITVKGGPYSGAMPAFKDRLDDEQLAAVLTGIRSQWGNAASPLDAATVGRVRERLKTRTGPFTGGAELAALP
jgi:mono/diheme cytochrome c family protein